MKYNPFIFSFLILIVLCGSINAIDNYIINNNSVYINDSKVFLSATPHTLSSSGWVYFNLTSKVYTGNIDVCWGFNTSVSKPTKAELYKPHWINTTADHQKTFYNPSFVVYTGDKLDYGNSYNTNHRYTVTEQIINDNGTIYITSNASFDSFNTDETNYTVYWHTRNDNYYLWKDFTDSFSLVNHDYKGFDKWYYIKNISIISDKEYTVRAWVDIPVSTEKQSGKYYFAIKPSHETIAQAVSNGHFYNLDPWWNATWSNRKKITLTGNTSGAQTDYQLLLNIAYDSNMQSDFDDLRFTNETHKLDSWLESKVDGSYALVWVEFPTTPANTVEQIYYMYYGNTGATSDWDIGATFIFGDDFQGSAIDTGKWDGKTSNAAVSGGVMSYGGDQTLDNMKSITQFGSTIAYRAKIKFLTASTYVGLCGLLNSDDMHRAYGYVTYTPTNYLIAKDGTTAQIVSTNNPLNTWFISDIKCVAGVSAAFFLDGVEMTNSPLTTYPPNTNDMEVAFRGRSNSACVQSEWVLVRKYVPNPPTYAFGSEETVSYMPPNPISLMNTTGNFWINHTWSPGSSNVTNSYNVSVNDVWHNTSPAYYNDTYSAHAWQNITVHAFNTSGVGTLSTGSINQNTQIPNNPITITNTSDWNGDAGEVVYVDYDATDIDSDTATFSCDRTDLFTDFDTSTGTGNWTATANIYYVDFGVSDGCGSISNYTMTLIESSVEITLLDELKLIMSEITTELKSINMGNYLVYAFILIGILFIILLIQMLNNCIYRG